MAIITSQFMRLRDGDRFWYQNGQFPTRQLESIEATGVTGPQRNMFHTREDGGS